MSGSPHEVQIQMPNKKDYLSLKPKQIERDIFVLAVARTDTRDNSEERDYVLGHHKFEKFPAKTEIRVTYKPEKMMPNLPSSKRSVFASDPIVGNRLPVSLP